MRRREFVGLVGGAATVWPLALRAQQVTPVIGFLNGSSADGYAPMVAAFGKGLKELGYVDGQTVTIEYRWAEGRYDKLSELVGDLIHRRVSVIAATSTPANLVAKKANETIVLRVGVTSILNLDKSFETVVIGDPNVIDVHTYDNRSVILEPLKIGAANIIFLNESSVVTANVRVFVCGIIRTKYREGSDCE
jgi:ABC-type uncharacterized transport system substrate-binding protein